MKYITPHFGVVRAKPFLTFDPTFLVGRIKITSLKIFHIRKSFKE